MLRKDLGLPERLPQRSSGCGCISKITLVVVSITACAVMALGAFAFLYLRQQDQARATFNPALIPVIAPPTPTLPVIRFPPTAGAQPLAPTSAPTSGKTSLGSEVRIGLIYPLSGRLEEINKWGSEALPIIEMAEADINALPEATAAGVRFRFVLRSSESTGEGALAAARDLVEKEKVRVIVGLPTSAELKGAIGYLTQNHIAAISSASTAPLEALRQPDTIYRIAPPELYLARTYARLAMHLGYRKAAVIYRTDGWGDLYAAEIAAQFKAQGYPTAIIPIAPTHPKVKDYAAEVAQLSAQVVKLGADKEMVVFMAVWEGEDLNILHHAASDPNLSRVRWFSAVLYPGLPTGEFADSGFNFPDARDFAAAHSMWGQEFRPEVNALVRRLLSESKKKLGREPRFEHIFVYDAMQIAARAVLSAGSADGGTVANAIPAAAKAYSPASGIIRFDQNGDRDSGNLAYFGLFRGAQGWEYRYYAYYDTAINQFRVLSSPEPRVIEFCHEC